MNIPGPLISKVNLARNWIGQLFGKNAAVSDSGLRYGPRVKSVVFDRAIPFQCSIQNRSAQDPMAESNLRFLCGQSNVMAEILSSCDQSVLKKMWLVCSLDAGLRDTFIKATHLETTLKIGAVFEFNINQEKDLDELVYYLETTKEEDRPKIKVKVGAEMAIIVEKQGVYENRRMRERQRLEDINAMMNSMAAVLEGDDLSKCSLADMLLELGKNRHDVEVVFGLINEAKCLQQASWANVVSAKAISAQVKLVIDSSLKKLTVDNLAGEIVVSKDAIINEVKLDSVNTGAKIVVEGRVNHFFVENPLGEVTVGLLSMIKDMTLCSQDNKGSINVQGFVERLNLLVVFGSLIIDPGAEVGSLALNLHSSESKIEIHGNIGKWTMRNFFADVMVGEKACIKEMEISRADSFAKLIVKGTVERFKKLGGDWTLEIGKGGRVGYSE